MVLLAISIVGSQFFTTWRRGGCVATRCAMSGPNSKRWKAAPWAITLPSKMLPKPHKSTQRILLLSQPPPKRSKSKKSQPWKQPKTSIKSKKRRKQNYWQRKKRTRNPWWPKMAYASFVAMRGAQNATSQMKRTLMMLATIIRGDLSSAILRNRGPAVQRSPFTTSTTSRSYLHVLLAPIRKSLSEECLFLLFNQFNFEIRR